MKNGFNLYSLKFPKNPFFLSFGFSSFFSYICYEAWDSTSPSFLPPRNILMNKGMRAPRTIVVRQTMTRVVVFTIST